MTQQKLAYFTLRLSQQDILSLSEHAAVSGKKPRTVAREVLQRYIDRSRIEQEKSAA